MRAAELPRHRMTDQEVVTATRLRCRLPLYAEASTCTHRRAIGDAPCRVSCDRFGDHALRCRLGGDVVRRRNRVRDTLARVLESALQQDVAVEQRPPDDTNRRPYLGFLSLRGEREWCDVAIVIPPAVRESAARDGVAAAGMEATKRRKYARYQLHPAVLEHAGRAGQGLQALMRAAHQGSASERAVALAAAWQDVAVSLQRGNVQILAAAGVLLGVWANQVFAVGGLPW